MVRIGLVVWGQDEVKSCHEEKFSEVKLSPAVVTVISLVNITGLMGIQKLNSKNTYTCSLGYF